MWVHQVYNYGLGNFINLTPTIKMLADHLGMRIPVYFDLAFIRDCFLDCEFIEILDRQPTEREEFGSWMVNFENRVPDYIYVYRELTKRYPLEGDLPHTYIDRADEIGVHRGKYTLFLRGSGNNSGPYLNMKMPADEYYEEYIKGLCLFAGSEGDKERSGRLFDTMDCYVGDVRESLALIRDAEFIVANDTGMAHAAGAMNKNMVVLWKNSALPKNANPGKNTLYRMCQ